MRCGKSRTWIGVWIGLGLILVPALTGCTKSKMHRPQSIERHEDYQLAFIEFDDQGEPWAPSQLERAIQLVEQANTGGKRSVVVLFVHGWQNDSSQREDRGKDNNVEGFQRLLQTAVDTGRAAGDWDEDTSLIGVYLSWRGRSTSVKPSTSTVWYGISPPFTQHTLSS